MYKVIPHLVQVEQSTGEVRSIFSAVAAGEHVEIEQRGWTVENTETGRRGIGRQPWPTEDEAQQWVDWMATSSN